MELGLWSMKNFYYCRFANSLVALTCLWSMKNFYGNTRDGVIYPNRPFFIALKSGLGRGGGNTNFGEHWSKSPGDERAVVSSARRRPRKTGSRLLSARRGFRRACDGSTKFCG